MRDCGTCMFRDEIILTGIVVHVHECMLRLCILLNSLLYICKSELRKSQSGIKGFFSATVERAGVRREPHASCGLCAACSTREYMYCMY